MNLQENPSPQLEQVLLIEDDFDDIYIHRRVIEESGMVKNLEIAKDGQTALDFLQRKGEYALRKELNPTPDLILIDISLPRMSGWDFINQYNDLPNSITMHPVLMVLTTSLNPDDEHRALSMPRVRRFLIKPLTQHEWVKLLKATFPSRFSYLSS
ncbi:MAG: response regulator [Bacteroidota bacterium]